MLEMILKRFESPDATHEFEKGRFETVTLGDMTIGRATYEPGWKWSEHVGPTVGQDLCPVPHIGMVVAGHATVAFPGREVVVMKPGDLFYVPEEPHDSWVVGDEQYVSLHFLGAEKYVR